MIVITAVVREPMARKRKRKATKRLLLKIPHRRPERVRTVTRRVQFRPLHRRTVRLILMPASRKLQPSQTLRRKRMIPTHCLPYRARRAMKNGAATASILLLLRILLRRVLLRHRRQRPLAPKARNPKETKSININTRTDSMHVRCSPRRARGTTIIINRTTTRPTHDHWLWLHLAVTINETTRELLCQEHCRRCDWHTQPTTRRSHTPGTMRLRRRKCKKRRTQLWASIAVCSAGITTTGIDRIRVCAAADVPFE